MHLIKSIRDRFNETCIVNKMEGSDCTVCLRGTPRPHLFIDLDLGGAPLGPNDVRCDYLAFVDDVEGMPCVAPVEFKSSWRKKIIVEQLQSGADEADKHVPKEFEYNFRPIGVLRSFSKGQRTNVRQYVSFRGRSEPIRIILCGDKFIDALRREYAKEK